MEAGSPLRLHPIRLCRLRLHLAPPLRHLATPCRCPRPRGLSWSQPLQLVDHTGGILKMFLKHSRKPNFRQNRDKTTAQARIQLSVRKQRLEGFCTLCMETREGKQVDTPMVFVINYIIASSSKNYQLVTCYIVIITMTTSRWTAGVESTCACQGGRRGRRTTGGTTSP